jgi:hypothetical protein
VRGGHLVRRGLFSAADLSYDGTRVLRVHYEMNSQQEVKSTTIYTTHVDGSRRVKIFKGRGDTSAEWVPTP